MLAALLGVGLSIVELRAASSELVFRPNPSFGAGGTVTISTNGNASDAHLQYSHDLNLTRFAAVDLSTFLGYRFGVAYENGTVLATGTGYNSSAARVIYDVRDIGPPLSGDGLLTWCGVDKTFDKVAFGCLGGSGDDIVACQGQGTYTFVSNGSSACNALIATPSLGSAKLRDVVLAGFEDTDASAVRFRPFYGVPGGYLARRFPTGDKASAEFRYATQGPGAYYFGGSAGNQSLVCKLDRQTFDFDFGWGGNGTMSSCTLGPEVGDLQRRVVGLTVDASGSPVALEERFLVSGSRSYEVVRYAVGNGLRSTLHAFSEAGGPSATEPPAMYNSRYDVATNYTTGTFHIVGGRSTTAQLASLWVAENASFGLQPDEGRYDLPLGAGFTGWVAVKDSELGAPRIVHTLRPNVSDVRILQLLGPQVVPEISFEDFETGCPGIFSVGGGGLDNASCPP